MNLYPKISVNNISALITLSPSISRLLYFCPENLSSKFRYYLITHTFISSITVNVNFRTEIAEVNAVAINTLNVDRRISFAGCCHPEV
jgi:hypothetical protein